MKRPKVLLCFDYQNGITYSFTIGTINLPFEILEIIVINTIQLKRTIEIANSKAKFFCNFKGSVEIVLEQKPKVNLKEKVYLETYYHDMLGQVQIDETPSKVQVQEL
jgi:hypothetical protein